MECMHIPRESRARQNFFFHQPWNVEIKLIYFLLNINNGITVVPGQKDHEHAIIPFSQIDVRVKFTFIFILHIKFLIFYSIFLYHILLAFLWRWDLWNFHNSIIFNLSVKFILSLKKCVSDVIHLLRIHLDLKNIMDKSIKLTGDHRCNIYLSVISSADKTNE